MLQGFDLHLIDTSSNSTQLYSVQTIMGRIKFHKGKNPFAMDNELPGQAVRSRTCELIFTKTDIRKNRMVLDACEGALNRCQRLWSSANGTKWAEKRTLDEWCVFLLDQIERETKDETCRKRLKSCGSALKREQSTWDFMYRQEAREERDLEEWCWYLQVVIDETDVKEQEQERLRNELLALGWCPDTNKFYRSP